VLIAAAADCADAAPVVPDQHLRADALGRGPARGDDGDQRRSVALFERANDRRKHGFLHVEIIQGAGG
jgi:hypothetical protein